LHLKGCSKAAQASPLDSKPKWNVYLEWHNECLDGDVKTIDTQIARYETAIENDANDQLALVYLGSACALRSKASFWGPSKLKYLKRGQKLMDEAAAAAPNDPRVLMVRAIGSYRVPKRFNRRPIAVADFEKLLPIVNNSSSDLQLNERQAILYYAWLTFKEEGHKDAQKAKNLCHQLDPASKYGKLTKP